MDKSFFVVPTSVYSEHMEKIRDLRFISLLIIGAAAVALAVYGWVAKLTHPEAQGVALASAQSDTDEACLLAETAQENKNVHLFVSCGGFLE